MKFSKKEWESELREDLRIELSRLCGIPIGSLLQGGQKSGLLEVVKNAVSTRIARALAEYSVEMATTEVIEEVIERARKELEKDLPKEDPKETEEEIRKRSKKPPSEGPCKMCKIVKPLNRLLLCFSCWLKDKLHRDSGGKWLPGDPHPAHCGCDGPGGCATKNQEN